MHILQNPDFFRAILSTKLDSVHYMYSKTYVFASINRKILSSFIVCGSQRMAPIIIPLKLSFWLKSKNMEFGISTLYCLEEANLF